MRRETSGNVFARWCDFLPCLRRSFKRHATIFSKFLWFWISENSHAIFTWFDHVKNHSMSFLCTVINHHRRAVFAFQFLFLSLPKSNQFSWHLNTFRCCFGGVFNHREKFFELFLIADNDDAATCVQRRCSEHLPTCFEDLEIDESRDKHLSHQE